MKKLCFILTAVIFILHFIACNSSENRNTISSDPIKITEGETAFNTYCSGCHNFRQNDIGPQLSGITKNQPADWVYSFIRNPQAVIQSNDKHAQQLYHQYKTTMPAFNTLDDSTIDNIIAFLNTHNEQKLQDDTTNAIHDPIPEKIPLSDLVVSIKPVIQIAASSDSEKKPLARITKLDYQPNTKKLFVVDLRGKLYRIENNKATVYLDIAQQRPNFINEPGLATGFGSFAFHRSLQKMVCFIQRIPKNQIQPKRILLMQIQLKQHCNGCLQNGNVMIRMLQHLKAPAANY